MSEEKSIPDDDYEEQYKTEKKKAVRWLLIRNGLIYLPCLVVRSTTGHIFMDLR